MISSRVGTAGSVAKRCDAIDPMAGGLGRLGCRLGFGGLGGGVRCRFRRWFCLRLRSRIGLVGQQQLDRMPGGRNTEEDRQGDERLRQTAAEESVDREPTGREGGEHESGTQGW